MSIAFLISAHNDVEHLKRLIESLPKEAEYFVHVDKKTDIMPFRNNIVNHKVHFIDERYDIMWGSFMQVKYQMALIRAAMMYGRDFDYLFSISGLDYPLWSNDKIYQFVKDNKGREFLYATCLATKDRAKTVLYREYRFLNNHSWKYGTLKSKFRVALRHIVKAIGIRKPLTVELDGKESPLYKGGSWWGISSALAKKVLAIYDNDEAFVHYFMTSFGPDETFVHTIAMNTEFSSQCTFLEDADELEDLSPLTYIEYGKEIKVFTEQDYDTLMKSNKMFCRKTITGKSDKLLDMIDKTRT